MAERRRWWRFLQVLIAVIVIALAARSIARNWSQLQNQSIPWRVAPGWMLGSVLVVLSCFALLIEAWRRVVVSQQQRLDFVPAARIWVLANLGKYIPGKVWAIAGAAVLAEKAGVERGAAVTSALVLQALALASGLMIVGVTGPWAMAGHGAYLLPLTILVAVTAGAGVLLLTSPRALARVQHMLPARLPTLRPISLTAALAGFAVNAVAWCGYGLALTMLAHGLASDVQLPWALSTAVFTASYLVGLVAILVPAGVGPRESLFILLLTGPLGVKLAVGLAVASRILLTLTELGAAVPFLVFSRLGQPPRPPALDNELSRNG
ncbi:MAG: lysylphosphatidylglycerol synthase domain-containing protein [Gemmatimonadota bacterium]